jgi:hypothetical protein
VLQGLAAAHGAQRRRQFLPIVRLTWAAHSIPGSVAGPPATPLEYLTAPAMTDREPLTYAAFRAWLQAPKSVGWTLTIEVDLPAARVVDMVLRTGQPLA